jgi:hypothetical protein
MLIEEQILKVSDNNARLCYMSLMREVLLSKLDRAETGLNLFLFLSQSWRQIPVQKLRQTKTIQPE